MTRGAKHDDSPTRHSRRISKNHALAAMLFAFVVLLYLVSLVRMGGG